MSITSSPPAEYEPARDRHVWVTDGDALPFALVSAVAVFALFERMGAHDGTIDDGLVREMARLLWRGITAR
ncbi:MAG TPA: hypothetical protein VHN98_07800 [Acidimicrobiales bacterium]|nr:hypothetical protein [Acidimicrobiales bacterium]